MLVIIIMAAGWCFQYILVISNICKKFSIHCAPNVKGIVDSNFYAIALMTIGMAVRLSFFPPIVEGIKIHKWSFFFTKITFLT